MLPQAFRTVISPLGSLIIAMIKNSAIIGVSLLALPDLLKQARIVQSRTFETDETFFWAAVGYLLLTGAVDAGHPQPRAPLRDPPMSYLFDPDNWEWLLDGQQRPVHPRGLPDQPRDRAHLDDLRADPRAGARAAAAVARRSPVSIATGLWVDVFRNLPLIFLILYFALGLPGSWKDAWEDAMPGWAPEAFQSGLVLGALLGLVLYNSAVLAEIMRAGILSLPRGQARGGRRARA